MRERTRWALVLIGAALSSSVRPASSAAQSQSSPLSASASTSTAPRTQIPPPRPFRAPGESSSPTANRTTPPASSSVRLAVQPLPSPATAATGAAIPPPRQIGEPRPSTSTSSAASPRETSDLASLTGDPALALKSAPLEATDLGFPINLATALRLSDARPLIVAAAQASVWVAEAQLTRAKVLWVPQLNLGGDYIRHDGGGPDFNKGIMTAPSVNFFYGGGGLWEIVALTDVFFEPLVKRQVLNSRQWDIQAAKNDAALMTATAYFNVHQYRGMYAGSLYCVERGRDLVERLRSLSNELVSEIEVQRARNLLADIEQQAASARQAWRVSSARLTRVLRLNPQAVVVPLEQDHLQITVIDPARPLPDLHVVALTNRPELASYQALVEAAVARIRREKGRMYLPTVLINGFQTPNELIQAGIFGLGTNDKLNQWVGRDDVSLQLMWQLEGMGIGNLARIKEQRGEQSKAIIDFFKIQDMVAADVTRAQADLQSAAARIEQADRSLRAGIATFNGSLEGLQNTTRFGDVLVLIHRPQEVVFALQLMKQSFDEYFTTVADYNRAQFELFHALGYPAREITYVRPPGNIEPVDTTRPDYLPPVGNGPPPATR
ncbi:MAG: TolC family protein [Isosphaeraceae bacterium]